MADSDSVFDRVTRTGKALGPVQKWPAGMPNPIMEAVKGTNAEPGGLGMTPNTYYAPGKYTAGGWTMNNGDVYVADGELPYANVVAHEANHARHVAAGGMPSNDVRGSWEYNARRALARNMEVIQPDADELPANAKWGLRPNSTAREQIANISGYYGALPKNTPITKSPIAAQLFDQNSYPDMPANDLLRYYYEKSSYPRASAYPEQTPEPGMGELVKQYAAKLAKQVVQKLGINTVNRGTPVGMPVPIEEPK